MARPTQMVFPDCQVRLGHALCHIQHEYQRIRVVQRRYVSSRTGERDTSIALQLELTGLSSVGVPADSFLERTIRGYSSRAVQP